MQTAINIRGKEFIPSDDEYLMQREADKLGIMGFVCYNRDKDINYEKGWYLVTACFPQRTCSVFLGRNKAISLAKLRMMKKV